AGNMDVAAPLASGWVAMEVVPQIPVVRQKPQCITYGPLQDTRYDPDVVLLRLNPKQVMIMHDAMPGMRMEGKPQCHIIAIAKEQQEVAASVGCMLRRVRTGLPNSQMTCAIPAQRLPEVVERLKITCAADLNVADYAAGEGRRIAQVLEGGGGFQEYDDLLRRLTTLVIKLDSSYDELVAMHREQQAFNRQQLGINERLTAAIERLDVTQARIETLLAHMIRSTENGQDA